MAQAMVLYIRFIGNWRDVDSRVEIGLFQSGMHTWWERHSTWRQNWQMVELRRELDWFNLHLDAPRKRYYRPYKKAERSGICWFRDGASTHIRHARYMAWLLGELGRPTGEIRTRNPGPIVWQDGLQVVSLPPRDMPRMFN